MIEGEFDDLRYMIIKTDEVAGIDFSQVFETSIDTLRLSVGGVYTFVKWIGDVPSTVDSLAYKDGEYTNDEILAILNSPEWAGNPF